MAIIRQLKNFFTKQVIYPKTLTKAVYDENGERLDNILRDTMLATDNEEYNGVEPRDADTLGGKYTKKDVESLIEENSELRKRLDELNSNLTYKFHKASAGVDVGGDGKTVTLPSKFSEITIIGRPSQNGQWSEITIPYEFLTDTEQQFVSGHYYTPTVGANATCICYKITKTTCRVDFCSTGNVDTSMSYYYNIYYK